MEHRYIASALSPRDAKRVETVIGELGDAAPELVVEGVALDVDPAVRRAVIELLRQLAGGTAVSIGPVSELLTTSQASEILGVSDTYVRRLADAGELTVEMRGSHRRFRLEELVRHRRRSDAARRERQG